MRILFVLLFMAQGIGVMAQSPQKLLEDLDQGRILKDMSFQMQITAFEGQKVRDTSTLQGFVKIGAGQSKALIYFLEPGSMKGRKMLMEGNYVYLLFPKTRNPIRLSPLQILMGESSNGDVARTGFSQDFDVRNLGEKNWEEKNCWVFDLTAKEGKKDATYQKVKLWAEKSSLRPLYAEFYAGSEKLMKKVFYRDYKSVLGKDLPMTLDIFDGENPEKHTVMTYKTVGQKPLAESVFRREYLESWSPGL